MKPNEKMNFSKGSRTTKWSEVAMVVISAILAFYTWQLFNTATEQSKYSQQSADAAIRAVRQDSINQAYSDSIQKISDSLNHQRDSINLIISENTFALQKTSLNDATNRFLNETQPYLQIDQFSIKHYSSDSQTFFYSYRITNLGKNIVRIDSSTENVIYSSFKKYALLTKCPFSDTLLPNMIAENLYLSNTGIIFAKYSQTFPSHYYQWFISKKIKMILLGKILYTNPINNKKRTYKYSVEILPNAVSTQFPTQTGIYHCSENEDLK